MIIHQNCRHFKGDVPCIHHKRHGTHCSGCDYYDPITFKILIIKLDASGDVLRTTCILQGLKENHPHSHIKWLTKVESLSLFENNDMVDGVIEYSTEASLQIKSENYNIVINTDAAPKSAMLAESAHGDLKLGFGYNKKGYVYPFNKEAQKWFEMGLFDDVKKANTHAYQKIILDMLCLKPSNYEIILKLSEDEKVFSKNFAELNGIKDKDLKIGLNTGAGGRWEFKKWTVEGFSILIDMINNEYPNSKILLYGGPEEKERNCLLAKKHNDIIIDTGYKNSIREFIALVDICDILVTGDTMALHIALALKKKILVLMGPTSSAEIHLYDRGKIVQADINCSCCYRQTCNNKPNCMELITPEMVFEALKEQID